MSASSHSSGRVGGTCDHRRVPAPPPAAASRCPWADATDDLRAYHDEEWGLPVRDERGLFERLSLEAFQSGLSWLTILRRRAGFRAAFHGFDVDRVASYDETDVARLMGDPGIIRNAAKVRATIGNARAAVDLRADGGLADLIWSFRPARTPAPQAPQDVPVTSPESAALSRALKRRGFAFVGPTTMHALMEAVGIIDTHLVGCPRRGCSGLYDEHGAAR